MVIDEEKMRNIVNEKVAEFELDIESIKTEAYKEFAARLKSYLLLNEKGSTISVISLENIDNLLKEMVDEEK